MWILKSEIYVAGEYLKFWNVIQEGANTLWTLKKHFFFSFSLATNLQETQLFCQADEALKTDPKK
jgi:hypothetical protein